MQTGYYAATGGMVAQFNRMDTIASNLANANTVGYKRDQLITGDFARLFKTVKVSFRSPIILKRRHSILTVLSHVSLKSPMPIPIIR
jgi:flagellar basal body rod protein FlgG